MTSCRLPFGLAAVRQHAFGVTPTCRCCAINSFYVLCSVSIRYYSVSAMFIVKWEKVKKKSNRLTPTFKEVVFFFSFITGCCGPALPGLTYFGYFFCPQETNKQTTIKHCCRNNKMEHQFNQGCTSKLLHKPWKSCNRLWLIQNRGL